MQPMDVALFKNFKSKWEKVYSDAVEASYAVGIQNCQFAPLFNKAMDLMNFKKILPRGFLRCGLLPFNVNAVDFSRLFLRTENLAHEVDQRVVNKDHTIALNVIENFLPDEVVKTFQLNDDYS